MRLDKERRLERRLERSDSKSIVTPSYIATLHSSFRSSQGFRGGGRGSNVVPELEQRAGI